MILSKATVVFCTITIVLFISVLTNVEVDAQKTTPSSKEKAAVKYIPITPVKVAPPPKETPPPEDPPKKTPPPSKEKSPSLQDPKNYPKSSNPSVSLPTPTINFHRTSYDHSDQIGFTITDQGMSQEYSEGSLYVDFRFPDGTERTFRFDETAPGTGIFELVLSLSPEVGYGYLWVDYSYTRGSAKKNNFNICFNFSINC